MTIAFATTMSTRGSTVIGRVMPLAEQFAKHHQVHVLVLNESKKSDNNIHLHTVGQEPFIRTKQGKTRLTSLPLIFCLLTIALKTTITLFRISPDAVIIVKSLPHNVLGVWLWSLFNKNKKIILDVDDFELTANILTSINQRAAIHWAERVGANLAETIVTASPFLKDHFEQLTQNKKKVVMIPTGISYDVTGDAAERLPARGTLSAQRDCGRRAGRAPVATGPADTNHMKRFLIRHLGNLGDMVFFIPPVLATLKKRYPDCHITFVTAWGFKAKGFSLSERKRVEGWGKRNQDGFCLALVATNPHIDQLVHWHDTKLSLDGKICREEGQSFPTWNKEYYEQQKKSGCYDKVFELDFGLRVNDNPLQRMYEAIGLPDETYFKYKLYFTEQDLEVARVVIDQAPRPRLVLLEGLAGTTTRGWDPGKIPSLEQAIKKTYGVPPIWFGSEYIPDYHGRPLTLRANIATLTYCDVGIGVPSGPLHLAAAAGLPTLTLYCDHPRQRVAPAYFLNKYIANPRRWHRTLMGPTTEPMKLLKNDQPALALTPAEVSQQRFQSWNKPGRQSTKTCLSVITADEIMLVLKQMLPI